VDAFAQFVGDDAVDKALPGDAVFAKESRRLNRHIEVRFAAAVGMGAGVAAVAGAVVVDLEARGRQSVGEFSPHTICISAHGYKDKHTPNEETRLCVLGVLTIFRAMSETRDRFTCSAGTNTAGTPCAWEGCAASGEFRAPKDRRLADYLMFCLDHVRAYNARWDFHAGATVADLEAEIRSAATWERPTWKLGTLGAGYRPGRRTGARPHVSDPFGFSAGTDFEDRKNARADDAQARATPGGATARNRALKVLDLSAPLTLESLKERYKALVKKYHPDANGGSAEAEDRMKTINEAYQTLKAGLAGA
jgi:hypothetical protein